MKATSGCPLLGVRRINRRPSTQATVETEDFPDPQATPGLQLQQESSPEGGRPVDQFIDGVAVEARP